MKKYAIIAFLLLLVVSFFLLWRQSQSLNAELSAKNASLAEEINLVKKTIIEKETVISGQNKRYYELITSINYNECENMPVSKELLDTAKELQK